LLLPSHAYNSSTRRLRQEDHKFLAWPIQQNKKKGKTRRKEITALEHRLILAFHFVFLSYATLWSKWSAGLILEKSRHQWLTPVILATQDAEIRRVMVRNQPGQIVHGVAKGVGPVFKPQCHLYIYIRKEQLNLPTQHYVQL
jgi:hypothetical protein